MGANVHDAGACGTRTQGRLDVFMSRSIRKLLRRHARSLALVHADFLDRCASALGERAICPTMGAQQSYAGPRTNVRSERLRSQCLARAARAMHVMLDACFGLNATAVRAGIMTRRERVARPIMLLMAGSQVCQPHHSLGTTGTVLTSAAGSKFTSGLRRMFASQNRSA